MVNMGIGVVELLVALVAAVFSLALPIAILVLLYRIYTKLKDIEEQLRKN